MACLYSGLYYLCCFTENPVLILGRMRIALLLPLLLLLLLLLLPLFYYNNKYSVLLLYVVYNHFECGIYSIHVTTTSFFIIYTIYSILRIFSHSRYFSISAPKAISALPPAMQPPRKPSACLQIPSHSYALAAWRCAVQKPSGDRCTLALGLSQVQSADIRSTYIPLRTENGERSR